MDLSEINTLRKALLGNRIIWNPDNETAFPVLYIGFHAEEGDDIDCAIFACGKYVALYNCKLNDFKVVNPIT